MELQPTLTGRLLALRPLRDADFDELYGVAADPLIWEQHPASDRHEAAVFREFFRVAMESGGAFAVTDRTSGRIIGSSRYHAHDPIRREVEIGWTFLARHYWGGRYNGEMKRLMLDHAFRFVDRVLFVVGARNVRSQRALEKLGAVPSGHGVDATLGDSVTYELTAQDWSSREPVTPGRLP
jgi:RimJ/RimL family protein N-acetyltransferase